MSVPAFHTLPSWAPMTAITLGRHIFLKAGASEAARQHEIVHVVQQERVGSLRFYLRYVLRPTWRVRYEAEAYRVTVRLGGLTAQEAAEAMASWLYLWPTSEWLAMAALMRFLP